MFTMMGPQNQTTGCDNKYMELGVGFRPRDEDQGE